MKAFCSRFNPDGTFAFADFGMADLTYAPFFQRYELNDYFWGFAPAPELRRIARWRQALADHPSVPEYELVTVTTTSSFTADYSLGFAQRCTAARQGEERTGSDDTVGRATEMPPRRIA